MSRLSVFLLGAVVALTADGEVIHFRTDKIRALLTYLILEGDRPHQRQSLAALLWPDMPEAPALKNLRQALHRLQQALAYKAPDLNAALFTITRQTIQCHPSRLLEVDALTFQALLAACEAHHHRHLHLCHDCLERLTQAADLYRGELLAGFGLPDAAPFEEWLLFWRERLHQQAVATLGKLTAAYTERGETERALAYATHQVALDPFREDAHRQVMRLLALNGQPGKALAHYESCRRFLRDELGVEPAAETTTLYRQIQAGLRGDATTTTLKPAILHHFPVQFTPFLGREREVGQIEGLFMDPDSRLLTLVGPGGMGKTRLSIRAAEQLAGRGGFADGIYFFSLAAVQNNESLLTSLLNGLGTPPSARMTPQERLLAYLRDRHCLLVLDNFEQLVTSAPLLAEMLAAAPGLRLLVTSHLPLNLRAERRLLLSGLDYPEEANPSANLTSYSAVRLFVESARHSHPSFHLDETNEQAVLQICRLTRGMPLALELAAAWVRVMDCADIAREIGRSLDFLSISPQDRPSRHQSMAAVLAYSWQLLSSAEQTTLGQLAVFRGPFSLEAAMTITEATPLILARLLDKSLVQRRKDGRYELHELLRQFVQQQTGEANQQVAQQHSNYYLDRLAAQESAFYGPQPLQAVAALQPDLDNIRQAWQWAITHEYWPAITRSLEGLGRFYQAAALLQEGEAMLAQALAHLETEGGRREELTAAPRLLIWHAYFLEKLGRKVEAVRLAQKALEWASQDEAARAEAHSLLGELLPHEGQFDQARAYQQQAIRYYRETADLGRLARALRRMALTCWRSGDHDEALRYFQQAIPLHQALEHKKGLAQLYNVLAGIYYEQNDVPQALAYVQQAQELYEAIEDKLDAAVVAANLARLYTHLGQFEQALTSNQRAIDISQELGDRTGLARDLSNRGYILGTMGEFDQSLDYYYRALNIAQALNNKARIADFQAGIAAVYAAKGDEETALDHYDLALPVLLAQGIPYHIVGPLLGKAELLWRRGDWAAARTLNEQALALATEAALAEYVQQGRILAAKLDFATGEEAAARRQLATLLSETADEAERAALHYELWRMTGERSYATAAVTGYRQICERVPSFVHKRRLATLENFLSPSQPSRRRG